MKQQKFKFHSDSGHGWLGVKRKVLADLNILNKISHYSYQRGQTVYLEEDCDMQVFTTAFKLRYAQDPAFTSGKYPESGRSPIRSYDQFQAEQRGSL